MNIVRCTGHLREGGTVKYVSSRIPIQYLDIKCVSVGPNSNYCAQLLLSRRPIMRGLCCLNGNALRKPG